jgi:hypothetical protein
MEGWPVIESSTIPMRNPVVSVGSISVVRSSSRQVSDSNPGVASKHRVRGDAFLACLAARSELLSTITTSYCSDGGLAHHDRGLASSRVSLRCSMAAHRFNSLIQLPGPWGPGPLAGLRASQIP